MFNIIHTLNAILADGANFSENSDTANIVQVGSKGIKYNLTVPTTDYTLVLGPVGTIGMVRAKNLAVLVRMLSTPAAPTVTVQGTAGSKSMSYKIVARQIDGPVTAASAATTVTTAADPLSATNFNLITWTAITGIADFYDVYRTATTSTTDTTTGLIGTIGGTATLQLSDTGLVGNGATPPAASSGDNVLLCGAVSGTYDLRLKGGDIAYFRWNAAAMHFKANTQPADLEITIFDD